MVYRALIRTHHMTSRKKIQAISKAAKKLDCALYIKTGGHPPGIMIAECEEEGNNGLAEWVAAVKALRYKDFQHMRSEEVEVGRLGVSPGGVKEFDHSKTFAADLEECGIREWWEEGMGFKKKDGGQDQK